MLKCPLRVDFGGGWLDVPRLAVQGAYIVNCAITPKVSLDAWWPHRYAGLGGSAAYAILNGRDSLRTELDAGVGWQDPAIIQETGLCVWASGELPRLVAKIEPTFLVGRMALSYTGYTSRTPELVTMPRDYRLIKTAGDKAAQAVRERSVDLLAEAIAMSYRTQLGEGMSEVPLVTGCLARKYCGGGHGGYVLHLFADVGSRDASGLTRIEPYTRTKKAPSSDGAEPRPLGARVVSRRSRR